MVQFLLSMGHHVVGLCHQQKHRVAGIDAVYGDVRSYSDICRIVQDVQPHAIIHLAAVHDAGGIDADLLYDTNVVGTINLLNAVKHHAPTTRICVVGSSAEYGMTAHNGNPLREDAPLRPITKYGITKVAQNMEAQKSWIKDHLPIMRTRTFNLIGPGQPASLAPGAFARQVAEAEIGLHASEIMTGRLSDYRDFIDVRDAIRAYWMVTMHGEPGQVYNVCSGRAVQIAEILDMLLELAAIELSVRTNEDSDTAPAIPYQCGSHELLSLHTGWQPHIGLEQSVRDLLAYWRNIVRDKRLSLEA
jgi:GDP-4-dehydro-6-deoxy-D-mannose reductase